MKGKSKKSKFLSEKQCVTIGDEVYDGRGEIELIDNIKKIELKKKKSRVELILNSEKSSPS